MAPLELYVGGTPVCPPLRRLPSDCAGNGLVARMKRINGALPAGWPFGLERELLRRGVCRLDLPEARVASEAGGRIRYRDAGRRVHLVERPPAEAAARLLWDRLSSGMLIPADLLDLAGALGGSPRFRTGRALTTAFASGHRLEYLKPALVPQRLDAMLAKLSRLPANDQPLLHAVGIYFDALLIHPLPDGNGRLARLLFQAALRQTIGLRAPIFPLGPACANNRPALIGAYLAWEFDRNARPLVDFIVAALEALVDLYERTAQPRNA